MKFVNFWFDIGNIYNLSELLVIGYFTHKNKIVL